jgi:GT2 family glycosyltransferase
MPAPGIKHLQVRISDMTDKKICVIVITYNGAKWVEGCFGSLMQSSVPLNIIAVDNASSDNTVALIKNKFAGVALIESGTNLGFGKANNIGLKRAAEDNADFIFLLNQDAFVKPDTIEILMKTALANEQYGIISPFHLLPGEKQLEWHFSTYISPEKCPGLVSDIYFKSEKELYPLPFVNAAAWLITRKCILETGGFDPLFPHYGEDEDYCNRALYKGFQIGVAPKASIVHDITMKSWDEIKSSMSRQLIFSFIELKNMNLNYRYLVFNFIKSRLERNASLLLTGRWKELGFMTKVFFKSAGYFGAIKRSRKIAKESFSYLN